MSTFPPLCPPRLDAWADWELEFMRRFYADYFTRAIAEVLGRGLHAVNTKAHHLGLEKSAEVIAEMARLRATDPTDPASTKAFRKGHVPWSTGKKMPGWAPGRAATTQFKKGQRPINWVPVGSLRINGEGELQRKFADVPGPHMNRWKDIKLTVWEEANGPVPKGMCLAWKPGRRTTELALITPDALEVITMAENMRRNTIHNLPAPLKEVVRLRATLTRAIRRREDNQS
jgi:hypothetical protein